MQKVGRLFLHLGEGVTTNNCGLLVCALEGLTVWFVMASTGIILYLSRDILSRGMWGNVKCLQIIHAVGLKPSPDDLIWPQYVTFVVYPNTKE